MRGIFISLEGSDGSGKSTLVHGLRERVRQAGLDMDFTREPGGTPIGEEIRDILLDNRNTEMDPHCEALLYAAARAQHTSQRIRPNLDRGQHVFTERFVLSSLAYQGYARDLGIPEVEAINHFATGGLRPDLILYMDADPLDLLKRKENQGETDRLEKSGMDFFRRIREGYEKAIEASNQVYRVDALAPPEEILEACWQTILERIEALS